LYIIGDDDKLLKNSINTIIKDIKENTEYYSINYKWFPELNWSTKRPIITSGLNSFIENIEGISQVLFISANIYNMTLIKENIQVGYQYQLSNAPHLSTLLVSLNGNENSKVLLSNQVIVHNGYENVPTEKQWSKAVLFMNIRFLLDLPLKIETKRILYAKIVYSFKLENLMNSLLMEYNLHKNKNTLYISFLKAVSYSSLYDSNFLRKSLINFSKLLIRFPFILNIARRILKNDK